MKLSYFDGVLRAAMCSPLGRPMQTIALQKKREMVELLIKLQHTEISNENLMLTHEVSTTL